MINYIAPAHHLDFYLTNLNKKSQVHLIEQP
jgi:hypothetical protein